MPDEPRLREAAENVVVDVGVVGVAGGALGGGGGVEEGESGVRVFLGFEEFKEALG